MVSDHSSESEKMDKGNQREHVLMSILGRYSRLEELGYRAYSSLSSYGGMEKGIYPESVEYSPENAVS
jgi:hypothetical protein